MCAAYILKYWETLSVSLISGKNGDTLFFMQMRTTRQPSSFNKVLAASRRSFFIDRVIMRKRWHIQFPIPLLSFLCPSTPGTLGDLSTDRMPLPLWQRKKYSEFWTPWKTLPKHRTLLFFFTIPESQVTLLSSFSFQNKNCYGSLFSPKESPWFYARLKANCLHFNHKMYSLLSLKWEYVCAVW